MQTAGDKLSDGQIRVMTRPSCPTVYGAAKTAVVSNEEPIANPSLDALVSVYAVGNVRPGRGVPQFVHFHRVMPEAYRMFGFVESTMI